MKATNKLSWIAPAVVAAAALTAYLLNRKKTGQKLADWWEKKNPHLFPGDEILRGHSVESAGIERTI
jgi:hypothetical protein